MNTLWQDLRYAIRMLIKNPGFTAVAVLTLALGIGANTAIFSVVNAVLLRPLPYVDPNRLVMVFETEPQLPKAPVTGPDYLDWRETNNVFEAMAAGTEGRANLTGVGDPQRVAALPVSAGFFEMLGVVPELGRPFSSTDDQPGHNQVAILTHMLWQEKFGSDPSIVGKQITLDGTVHEVIGVMPARFIFPEIWGLKPDLWTPLGLQRDEGTRGSHWLWVMARLKPGKTIEEAQTEIAGISSRIAAQYPQSNGDIGARVISLREQLTGDATPALLMLFVAVGFILLIACANVANLLLARTAGRQREIAIRVALGASRSRLVRQALTESILLSVAGGTAGLLLASWTKDTLIRLTPAIYIPATGGIDLSQEVFLFTLLVSVLTGILFGLPPALQSTRVSLNESLKEGTHNVGGAVRGRLLRSALVVAEISLGFVLLIGTGLMVRSLQKLLDVNPGFNPQNVLTMQLELPDSRYSKSDRRRTFFNTLLERAKTLPGVQFAAAASQLPLSGGPNGVILIEGRPRPSGFGGPLVQPNSVTSDYFRAMAIPLMSGRAFQEANAPESTGVVIINQTLARQFWPNEDPIGKRLSYGTDDPPVWMEVVGIVGDVRQWDMGREAIPEVYFSYQQWPQSAMAIVIRSSIDPSSLTKALRAQFQELDKDLPLASPVTMDSVLGRSTAIPRFHALLMGVFGALALILVSVGIYGVVSYTVEQHTREIGIRVALGARQRDVLKLIVKQGMLLTMAGLAVGIAGAIALARVMSNLLFSVSTTDPATFAGVSTVLAAVALLASYLPARRATKVDPMVALRYE